MSRKAGRGDVSMTKWRKKIERKQREAIQTSDELNKVTGIISITNIARVSGHPKIWWHP